MNRNNRVSIFGLVAAVFMMAIAAKCTTAPGTSADAPSSIQVSRVDTGDVDLEPSFQIAIYENLLDELNKTKRFKQVFRDGDRNASAVSDLLILKTAVQKYAPGSETRRAVTTFSGATKLTVRSQLVTRDGQVILERTVDGNVRFMGGNLRATHNLARNVAKGITQSSLQVPSQSVPAQSGQRSGASTKLVRSQSGAS